MAKQTASAPSRGVDSAGLAEPTMIHFRASVSTEDLKMFRLFEHDTDPDSYDDQAGATVPDPRSR
jgi:hypothetical protein